MKEMCVCAQNSSVFPRSTSAESPVSQFAARFGPVFAMEDDDSPSYKTKRPAPVHGDELSKALPTPEVDDCPTPMLAAITGLEKLRIREEMAQTPASVTLEPMPEEPSTAGAAKRRRARKSRAGRRAGGGGAGPKGLQAPFVLQPRTPQAHARTVIMLHGFTSTGKQLASGWLPALAKALGRRTLGAPRAPLQRRPRCARPRPTARPPPPSPPADTLKLVFLNAPIRTVSCYGDERPRHPAWHDYFTDHGGDEGRRRAARRVSGVVCTDSRVIASHPTPQARPRGGDRRGAGGVGARADPRRHRRRGPTLHFARPEVPSGAPP